MFNEFKFAIPITRAYTNENGEMLFEGIASSTSIDTFETVFNRNCQDSFAFDIIRGMENGEPVELEAEHLGDEEPMNILGAVVNAEVTEDSRLKIIARLDSDNPKAIYYFKKMTVPDVVTGKTKQFGLSINGVVKDAEYQYNEELRKNIRVFKRVQLRKIGIVRRPSNPDSWIEKIIRSVEWSDVSMQEETEVERNSPDLKQLIEMLMHVYQAMEMMEMEEPEEEDDMESDDSQEEDDSESEDEYSDEQLMMAMEYMSKKMRGWMKKKRASDTSNSTESMKQDLSDEYMLLERAKYDGIDFSPPEGVKAKLRKGLKLYEDGRGGKGLVAATISWARKLAAGENISPEKARKMSAWHARHAVDKRPGWDKAGEETPGYVANLLWGGEPGRNWADRLVQAMEKKDSEMKETRQEEVVLDSAEAVETVSAEAEVVETREEEAQEQEAAEVELTEEAVEAEDATEEVVADEPAERVDTSVESLVSAVASIVDEKISELRSSLESSLKDIIEQNTQLRSELSEVRKSNDELVQRLEKVESEPATKPGVQLLESVTREDSSAEKREQNIKRAKEANDTHELIKHKIFGSRYLGYGEFV